MGKLLIPITTRSKLFNRLTAPTSSEMQKVLDTSEPIKEALSETIYHFRCDLDYIATTHVNQQ